MCGRYTLTMTPDELKRLFRYLETPNFPPRYNIAPTQPIAIVRAERGERHFHLVRWGLIPSWVKDPASFTLLINARIETAREKPAFRAAYKYRRCLIPASGFYEWRRDGKAKQAFFIRPRHGGAIAFAGLWETWLGADGSEIDTAAILTAEANGLMRPIHDRMPVVLDPAAWDEWLGSGGGPDQASALSGGRSLPVPPPVPDDLLEAIPVSDRVNAVRNDDASLQAPLSEPLTVDAPEPVAGDDDTAVAPPRQGTLF